MNEMKVWMTPEVEVQNFQANEYVSACYSSNGYQGEDENFLQWLLKIIFGERTGLFYYEKDDVGKKNPIKIDGNRNINGDPIGDDSLYNSGTLFTEVYKGTRQWEGSLINGEWGDWDIDQKPEKDLQIFDSVNGGLFVGSFKPNGDVRYGDNCKPWS